MNHIYRVVFNRSTQTWNAVAEYARAQGKGSSTTVGSSSAADQPSTSGQLLRLSLVSSALLLAAHAQAATGTDLPAGQSDADGSSANYCYYHTDWDTVICGDGSTTNGTASNGVVLGKTAKMTGNSAIAIGNGTVSAVNAVSIGRDAKAANARDIAIGNNAGLNRGDKGSNFTAGTAFAAGTVYSGGATQTNASIATNNGISLGQNAGTNSTGINNTMIGTAAGEQLFGDNTVTIGTNANNYRVNGFSNGQINTNNNTVDALSGNTRAANAVNRSRKSVAIGNNAMTYDDSNIAIGDGAKSLGASSIAMGTGARAGMAYATVGGVTRGDKGSIAIGNNSVAPLEGDLSIGVNAGSRVNQNTTTTSNMQTTKNISVGYEVGGNVYGYTNSVFGTSSGGNIGTAAAPNYANVAIGDQVGNAIRGNNNVNIGYQGGSRIMSNSNTSIGSRSGSDVNGANNVTTGTFAGTFVSGNANWAAGKDSGTHVGVLSNANRLDINTGNFVASDGTVLTRRNATNNVAAGEFTGRYVGGSKNIAFGQNAGEYVGHKGTTFGAVSNNNIAMGEQTGRFIEGSYNYASGYQAGSGTAINATLVRNNSISQGVRATAYTNDSIAIGTDAIAGVQSTNGAGKVNAIAIGKGAQATGAQSISVGTGNIVSGDNSGAFGDPTTISGTGSYSVGNNNTIATNDTFVVGSNVTKTLDNSVFLGKDAAYTAKGASTDGVEKVSDATVGGITYAGTSFAGQTPVGVVSVGDVGKERRIQNVAAGLISATSTDAINGSQLYMVAKELGEEVQNTYFHTNTGAANQEAGNATTNLGSITSKAGATGTNAVTAGKNATASGQNAVAVGESATANAIQVTSVGHNAGLNSTNAANSTFIGTGAGMNSDGTRQGTGLSSAYNTYVGSSAGNGATGVHNTAVGGNNAGAGMTGDANAAFGHASLYNTTGDLNTGLGAYAGQNSTGDSNTSVGENAGRYVTGDYNTALGSNAGTRTTGNNNVAIGLDAGQAISASDTVSIGNGAKATEDKSVALGSGATTAAAVGTTDATVNGINYGTFAGTAPIATVSVGSAGNERTITNVAAGRISATSTDAINGSQLYMTNDRLGNVAKAVVNNFGGNAALNPNTGDITFTDIGGTGEDNIHDAIKSVSTAAAAANRTNYFHVNTGVAGQAEGDATTNEGTVDAKGGAKYTGAITAGLNTTAISEHSISIGQDARAGAENNFSNWANLTNPATGAKFTSEQELRDYFAANQNNNNQVYRAVVGKRSDIAIGHGAVAEGGRNISIGEFAGVGTADNWNIMNVNIGTEAGQNSKKDYSVAVGYRAGALTDAQQLIQEGVVDGGRHPSVLIGKQAGEGTVAYGTVAIGQDAGKNISDIRSIKNIAIGNGAGEAVSSNDGRNATFPGFGSGANTMIGAASGRGLVGDGNVAIGNLSGSGTTGDNNFFGGHLAGANGSSDRSIIIGSHAGEEITSDRSVFIGNYAHSEKKGNVVTGIAIGNSTLAGKNTDGSTTYNSIAIGNSAAATNDNTIALGRSASASGLRSTAIGSGAESSGEQAIAIGRGAQATGAQSISVGTGNVVSGDNSGAFGDPTTISGTGSYSVGNNNTIATNDTFVVGSNVVTTADNSVFLGKEAAYTAKGASTDGIGAVTEPVTVSGVSYGDFAGKTSVGVVSVGDVGKERRIQNVAAGLISATSTDAINGSQLYMVAQGTLDQMPVVYTDTNGNKVYKKPDGTFVNDAGDVVAPTDVIASMNNGADSTTTPMTLTNIEGNLNGAKTGTTAPTTVGTAPANVADISNNAATVGDVLNAGWNLQGNGTAADFVKPYDTVNFVNGNATTATVTSDGTTSTIKYDVAVDDNTVKIVDGKLTATFTPPETGTITNTDGKAVPTPGDENKFATVGNVAEAINNSGFTLTAEGENSSLVNPGDTVDMNNTDGNIEITKTADSNDVTYNLAKNIDLTDTGSVTTGNTVINNAGLTVGDITVTNAPITVNGTTVNNINDAINQTAAQAFSPLTFAGDYGTGIDKTNKSFERKLGETVNIIGGNNGDNLSEQNIGVVSNNADTLEIKLSRDLKDLNSAVFASATGQTVLTPDGLRTYTNNAGDLVAGPSITNKGIDAANTVITNVAPGVADTDAVNVSQLKTAVASSKENVVSADKTVTVTPTIDKTTGATTFDLAVNTGSSLKVDSTTGAIDVNTDGTTITTDPTTGAIKANTTPLINTDGKVDTPALPNALATAGDIANAINNSGWKLAAEGTDGNELINPSDIVTFKAGSSNLTVARASSDITYDLAKDININSVQFNGGPKITNDGNNIKIGDKDGNATKITNVAAGEANTDAVNVSQLKDAQAAATTKVEAGDNMVVTSTANADGSTTYTVATAKDVDFNSVTVGPVVINQDGINAGDTKITNVKDGDITAGSKDAVNGSQLYSAINNINSSISASKEEVTSNDKSVTVTTTQNANGANVYDLSVNTDGTTITKNADGALTINTTPLTNNANGTVNTPANPNAMATAGDIANAINNSGFNLTAQGSNGSLVKPGATVDMNNTDGNIVISKSASDNNVTYNLAKDINVDSVTTGNTVVNNAGVTINNADPAKTVSITETGLNNGGNTITNVAAGVNDTDAVNVGQLKAANQQINNNIAHLDGKINQVDRDLRGGIASAVATAGIPQAFLPGKSMVAMAAATYRGQSALAIGVSRISDNGKIIIKATGSTNTRGDVSASIGAGYQW